MKFEPVLTRRFGTPDSPRLSGYQADGGYEGLKKALAMDAGAIIQTVTDSGLRGRGGAGFPTGRKWSFVPRDSGQPVYLTVNGDEGEPGTSKDREIMLRDPHRLIEGVLIAAVALGCELAYIYIRGEYGREIRAMEAALAEARDAGLVGDDVLGSGKKVRIYVQPGAGAYICGEETGMLSSIEGKPGKPKLKPPFPAVKGLFGCPTVVNNVETLACVPDIIVRGPDWFKSYGSPGNAGTRIFCLSGQLEKPGVYELPLGISLRRIIEEVGGGVRGGRKLGGVIPGGVSAPVLTPDEIDVPHDFDCLAKIGTMAGSAGVIVFDEDADVVAIATCIARFFAHESCGQCTQCREGTKWLARVLERFHDGEGTRQEIDLMLDVCAGMKGQTICVLSDGAAMAAEGFLQKYRPAFEARCCGEQLERNDRPWRE